jgi:hypothetical protein
MVFLSYSIIVLFAAPTLHSLQFPTKSSFIFLLQILPFQNPDIETPLNVLSARKIASHHAKTGIVSPIDRNEFVVGSCQIASEK